MPALSEAAKLGSNAAKSGFDWPDVSGLMGKLREETAEIEAEPPGASNNPQAITEELGDLLFTAVNLARHLKIDPELALRDTNAKFVAASAPWKPPARTLEKLAPGRTRIPLNRAKLAGIQALTLAPEAWQDRSV